MSFKPKIIVLSVAALIAAGGGLYASMPGDPESAPGSRNNIDLVQSVAQADVTGRQETANAPHDDSAKTGNASATAAQAPVANEAPKKLTRQELTPPPASEEEKLQKSAEQESNF